MRDGKIGKPRRLHGRPFATVPLAVCLLGGLASLGSVPDLVEAGTKAPRCLEYKVLAQGGCVNPQPDTTPPSWVFKYYLVVLYNGTKTEEAGRQVEEQLKQKASVVPVARIDGTKQRGSNSKDPYGCGSAVECLNSHQLKVDRGVSDFIRPEANTWKVLITLLPEDAEGPTSRDDRLTEARNLGGRKDLVLATGAVRLIPATSSAQDMSTQIVREVSDVARSLTPGTPPSTTPETAAQIPAPRTQTAPPPTDATARRPPSSSYTLPSQEIALPPTQSTSSPVVPVLAGLLVVLAGIAAGLWFALVRRRSPTPALAGPGPPGAPQPSETVTAPLAAPAVGAAAPPPPDQLEPDRGLGPSQSAPRLPRGSIRIVTADEPAPSDADGRVGRVDPSRSALGWTWAHEQRGLMVMALWLERRSGKGEDAQPSFLFDPTLGTGMLATYDGTGGSGSALVRTTSSGRELSGAFLAARLARSATEEWFARSLDDGQPDAPPEQQLHDTLSLRFVTERDRGLTASEKFAGSLRRELPTTLAASAFHAGNGRLSVTSLWAGDSRCHVLTPRAGLQQLTVDDSPVTDALEAIITDAPMTNVVSADREFKINRRNFDLAGQSVLISSTDGCFGYVATPAHYEYLLLQGLRTASSPTAWGEAVLSQLDNFTGDDASLVLAAFGWKSFEHLRHDFTERTQLLHADHWTPFNGIANGDREHLLAARNASWQSYRPLYSQYLPRPEAAAPSAAGASDPDLHDGVREP